jgi:hypothetical protein
VGLPILKAKAGRAKRKAMAELLSMGTASRNCWPEDDEEDAALLLETPSPPVVIKWRRGFEMDHLEHLNFALIGLNGVGATFLRCFFPDAYMIGTVATSFTAVTSFSLCLFTIHVVF